MNSLFLFEKLENSDEFNKFIEGNKDAYLCSGFFIIDKDEKPQNKYHFDFYVPSKSKTFSFEMEEGIKFVELERLTEIVLEKVSMKEGVDFDNLEEMIIREMEFKKINNKIQKLIFSLQSKDGKDILIGTVFVSGLGMISVNFDISQKKIIDFEKKSLFDMMKIIKK